MLFYANVGISELEIPTKKSLVIYLSDCKNHCTFCHTPYLQKSYGDTLKNHFETLFQLYYDYFDVVCFMGEGKNTEKERKEMIHYCKYIHKNRKQVALYCGRDCDIEKWMTFFDYIKIGSYQKEKGPLTKITTNQRLWKKNVNGYCDITDIFWKK